MLKVTQISTHSEGGAGLASLRLHNILNKRGVKSLYLQRGSSLNNTHNHQFIDPIKHNLYSRLRNKLGIPILEWHKNNKLKIGRQGKYEKLSFPNNDFVVEKHQFINEADIINLHWISDFVNYNSFFQVIKNKPIVWTIHDMNPFKGLFHYHQDELNNLEIFNDLNQQAIHSKSIAYSNLTNLTIVSPSKWLMEASKSSSLLSRFKHRVIANSIPDIWFDTIVPSKRIVELHHNLPTLLFVALDLDCPRKGVHYLKAALERLTPFSVQLLLIGNKSVDFPNQYCYNLGYIKDENRLREIYALADLYILPSLEDNLPNVMLESLASGTPVLAFNTGGMAEYIVNGKNGLLAQLKNTEDLFNKLNLIINNEIVFDRATIKKEALKSFNENKQADAYIELYKSLVE